MLGTLAPFINPILPEITATHNSSGTLALPYGYRRLDITAVGGNGNSGTAGTAGTSGTNGTAGNEGVLGGAGNGGTGGTTGGAGSAGNPTGDVDPAVRVAASLALSRLGQPQNGASIILKTIEDDNWLAGMYAIRALEWSGIRTPAAQAAVNRALDSPYEFTRRIAKRLSAQF